MYILRPHAPGILYAPPFYTPPTPRRVFSGEGGWACIKFGPVLYFVGLIKTPQNSHKFRSQKWKKSPTSFRRSAGRTYLELNTYGKLSGRAAETACCVPFLHGQGGPGG